MTSTRPVLCSVQSIVFFGIVGKPQQIIGRNVKHGGDFQFDVVTGDTAAVLVLGQGGIADMQPVGHFFLSKTRLFTQLSDSVAYNGKHRLTTSD